MNRHLGKLKKIKAIFYASFYGYVGSAYPSYVESFNTEISKFDAALAGKVVGGILVFAFCYAAWNALKNISVTVGISIFLLAFGLGFTADYLINHFIAGDAAAGVAGN